MVKIIKYVVTLTLFMIINSCSIYDHDVTAPYLDTINYGDTTNAILLSSFEFNGMPSLEGWQPRDSLSISKYSFSNYVPNGGGTWSVYLWEVNYTEIGIDTTIELSASDSLKNYILTFWAMGKGGAVFSIDAADRGMVVLSPVNCRAWTFFADTLFRNDAKFNKLRILLTPWASDSLSDVFFDNIKVVVKAK